MHRRIMNTDKIIESVFIYMVEALLILSVCTGGGICEEYNAADDQDFIDMSHDTLLSPQARQSLTRYFTEKSKHQLPEAHSSVLEHEAANHFLSKCVQVYEVIQARGDAPPYAPDTKLPLEYQIKDKRDVWSVADIADLLKTIKEDRGANHNVKLPVLRFGGK